MMRILTNVRAPCALAAACLMLLPLGLPGAGSVPIVDQDDAGSGRDAPEALADALLIEPGRVYEGNLTGIVGDDFDAYAFDATQGQTLDVRVAGLIGCYRVQDPTGAEVDFSCAYGYVQPLPFQMPITQTGRWTLTYSYFEPEHYRFSIGLDRLAPEPMPADTLLLGGTDDPVLPSVAPAGVTGEHVVVAVVDTGINPYHGFFRAPGLSSHPSGWLAGFPASAQPVPLTFGHASVPDALAADAAAWAQVQPSSYNAATDAFTENLYTFPGTRIVAAISFGEYEDALTPVPVYRTVYDDHGHGTHSAGLAAGADLPAADGNVLIVAVEIGKGTFDEGIRWAARQPWIDAISVSLGTVANVPGPTAFPAGPGADDATREAFLSGKPVFLASGNGVSNTGLAPDRCTTYTSEYTGPSWVTRVGAAEGDATSRWHCAPVDAIARTDRFSPDNDSLTAAGSASGTSAATPNLAGHWASLMLEARRAGLPASRLDARDHLLAAAKAPPAEPALLPAGVAVAERGHGLVDAQAVQDALATLTAGAPTPRPELAAWLAQDRAIRDALWAPDGQVQGLGAQDDAGSGTDAPDTRSDRVRVEPGRVYRGTSTPLDGNDHYAFAGLAGQVVDARIAGAFGCLHILRMDGGELDFTCVFAGVQLTTATATLPEDGTYLLHYQSVADVYWFAFALDAPAPAPTPWV